MDYYSVCISLKAFKESLQVVCLMMPTAPDEEKPSFFQTEFNTFIKEIYFIFKIIFRENGVSHVAIVTCLIWFI